MQPQKLALFTAAALGIGLLTPVPRALAANDDAESGASCHMDFNLRGWSAIYRNAIGTVSVGDRIRERTRRSRKTTSGSGTVTCTNGQIMNINVTARGGAESVGQYQLRDGYGTFTNVTGIGQVLGSYRRTPTHAVAMAGRSASAMAKGNIGLVISGDGGGWDIGTGFPSFTISAAD